MRRGTALLVSLTAAAALAAAGCASVPLPERDGVALYRAKCSGCHRPYAPSEIKPAAWQATFAEMRKKAKLNEDEAAVIQRYVEVDLVASHAPLAAR